MNSSPYITVTLWYKQRNNWTHVLLRQDLEKCAYLISALFEPIWSSMVHFRAFVFSYVLKYHIQKFYLLHSDTAIMFHSLPAFSLLDWLNYLIGHRGLKLDGTIGQGEICNSLKSEKFSKSFLSHIGKNKIKF